ncbi:MAG: hypothetical protein MZV65_13995 [Chromatiales bacterium]|nr:hypothetical protein [Chromatiales bacterium]
MLNMFFMKNNEKNARRPDITGVASHAYGNFTQKFEIDVPGAFVKADADNAADDHLGA